MPRRLISSWCPRCAIHITDVHLCLGYGLWHKMHCHLGKSDGCPACVSTRGRNHQCSQECLPTRAECPEGHQTSSCCTCIEEVTSQSRNINLSKGEKKKKSVVAALAQVIQNRFCQCTVMGITVVNDMTSRNEKPQNFRTIPEDNKLLGDIKKKYLKSLQFKIFSVFFCKRTN